MVKIIQLNGDDFLFISGNVPALKNSKIKTSKFIFSSKRVKDYIKNLGIQSYSPSKKIVKNYVTRPNEFLKCKEYFDKYLNTKPYKIGFHFVRATKHKFDFGNAVEILADLLTAHDFIEDDNMDIFLPYPLEIDGKAYTYNPENPGVYIKILN